MENQATSTKRLLKNTVLLYFRTIVTMCLNLYISRVVLEALGVADYGIYNVVGGLVTFFSIFSASLTNSITRYLTYELGHGDRKKLKTIFSTSLNIQVILSVIIVVIVEIGGLWFLNFKMNIPPGRLGAANWVLQLSLVTFVLNLISLPYNASIISHEKMDVYAYISILEVVLRLVAVLTIPLFSMDSLILYAFYLTVVALAIRILYQVYCTYRFDECKYIAVLDKKLLKGMFGFAGWNMFGTSAYILNTQGVDLLVNLFFGVIVNAARGVATQATNAVRNFVNNFTIAINPQIIKAYAAKDYSACFNSVNLGAKFSYILMLLMFIPFVLEADYILYLWLKNVPQETSLFFQLAMLGVLVDLPGAPLTILAQATGDIKKFYIWMGLLGCLPFPLTYIAFEMGMPDYIAYVIYAIVYTYLVYVRLILMKRQIQFPVMPFIKDVIFPILIVTAISFIFPILIHQALHTGIVRLTLVTLSSTLSISISVYFIAMTKVEREKVRVIINKKLHRL